MYNAYNGYGLRLGLGLRLPPTTPGPPTLPTPPTTPNPPEPLGIEPVATLEVDDELPLALLAVDTVEIKCGIMFMSDCFFELTSYNKDLKGHRISSL